LREDPSVLPLLSKVGADSLLQTTHLAQPAIVVVCLALEVLGDRWIRKKQKAVVWQLLTCYQHADEATVLTVMESPLKLVIRPVSR
jgi:hypothetical protein